ncbi:S9 family peptidase [Cryobacterium frigoriphilum]|uniref:S9 family peptidase n=1 Tax=Cryobacterium frigoriphilum TaxID=1259150 RepID=A0A4R9A3Z4_9MICO|nr:S9 family peptidase [Cryobacterium frigoriphilum]TFD51567.1 S9 family peptidase [Cryobacterium frigoriphilum]
MQAPDLPLLWSVSRPSLHPDGTRAVVAVTRPDFVSDDYVGQLWMVGLAAAGTTAAAPQRLTRGHRDTAPRFSPDGRLLAFLRAGPGTPAQLFVVSAAGGEPLQVTHAPLGVGEFRWNPASTQLGFLARVPEPGRYGTVPGLDSGSEPPRRVTTRRFRSNGVGYVIDRRTHVFLVAVPDVWGEPTPEPAPAVEDAAPAGAPADRTLALGFPEARQLSSGDYEHAGLSFSPDGTRVLTISARHARHDEDLRSELVEILTDPASDGPRLPERVVLDASANLGIDCVVWAPDASIVLLATDVGPDGRDFVGRGTALYRAVLPGAVLADTVLADTVLADTGVPGAVTLTRLTDPETSSFDAVAGLSVTADGSVLAHRQQRGTVQLVQFSPNGTTRSITDRELVVTGHDVQGDVVVFGYEDALTRGDLAVAALAAGQAPAGQATVGQATVGQATVGQATVGPAAVGPAARPRRLTDFSLPLREAGVAPARDLVVTSRDGYPVHGWLLTPSGPGPHPVLLTIHGGPFAQYTVGLLDEAQILVDAGYAVVMCNPRGSAGYGQDHGRSIRHRLGTIDETDVLDFLAGALTADPSLDAGRLGIMGGSYGGFLTAWIIARDHRFAASIVERGFLDPEAFMGTSDIGDFFGQEYVGIDPERMRAQSPQAHVAQVRTPTLLIHSSQDLRCPQAQSERYYAALKRGGVPAELVIFPGENHELTRSGNPRHRLQRFTIVLEWWARFLPTDRNPRGGSAEFAA